MPMDGASCPLALPEVPCDTESTDETQMGDGKAPLMTTDAFLPVA